MHSMADEQSRCKIIMLCAPSHRSHLTLLCDFSRPVSVSFLPCSHYDLTLSKFISLLLHYHISLCCRAHLTRACLLPTSLFRAESCTYPLMLQHPRQAHLTQNLAQLHCLHPLLDTAFILPSHGDQSLISAWKADTFIVSST